MTFTIRRILPWATTVEVTWESYDADEEVKGTQDRILEITVALRMLEETERLVNARKPPP